MILESLAGIIGTRRALQIKAIGTLTKHLAEGPRHRYNRIGPNNYYAERYALSGAIPAIDIEQADRRHPAAQYLDRVSADFKHGYATGRPIHWYYQDEAE